MERYDKKVGITELSLEYQKKKWVLTLLFNYLLITK